MASCRNPYLETIPVTLPANCRMCGAELTDSNWQPLTRREGRRICAKCDNNTKSPSEGCGC